MRFTRNTRFRSCFVFLFVCGFLFGSTFAVWSQGAFTATRGGATYFSFIDYQRTLLRPQEAIVRKVDTLKKQFAAKKLIWPANYIYLRSFKYDSQLEVWVKQYPTDSFRFFKTYPVCALAGSLGPKRMEGDFQVPEGFYYINEFNSSGSYHLSLGLNYPNASDRVLSDSLKPGGEIYIHGNCVTVGCIPITDDPIEELYVLAAFARDQGQHFIPVHIFPCRYNVPRSVAYLQEVVKDDPVLRDFSSQLEGAFYHFEKNRTLPIVMITDDGRYHINGIKSAAAPLVRQITPLAEQKSSGQVLAKITRPSQMRLISDLPEYVDQWPNYPGGNEAYTAFLEKVCKETAAFLPAGIKRALIHLEFVVDKDGTPVNFSIVRGLPGAQQLQDQLIEKLEAMSTWTPAELSRKPVAKKMFQILAIESN